MASAFEAMKKRMAAMRSAKQPKASSSSKSTSNSSSASAPPPPSTQTSTSKSLKPKSPSPRSQKVGGNTDEDVSPGAVRFSAQICQDGKLFPMAILASIPHRSVVPALMKYSDSSRHFLFAIAAATEKEI